MRFILLTQKLEEIDVGLCSKPTNHVILFVCVCVYILCLLTLKFLWHAYLITCSDLTGKNGANE